MPPDQQFSTRDPLQNSGSVYSIGTAYAIDGLERHFATGDSNTDLVMINLSTMIRNILNEHRDLSGTALVRRLQGELQVLVVDVAGLMTMSKTRNKNIVLYINDYRRSIPVDLLRPPNKTREAVIKQAEFVMAAHKQLLQNATSIHGVNVFLISYAGTSVPHRHLLTKTRGMSIGTCIMLSHIALDYHLGRHMRDFRIVDSHTGSMRTHKEIGKKVFGKEIPFNHSTHPLLGDKSHLLPMLKIKDKRVLYTAAQEQHWETKTDDDIVRAIKSLGFDPFAQVDLR